MMPAAASGVAAPSGSRAAQLQDLNFVRTEYLPKDMAFSPAARGLADKGFHIGNRRSGPD
jgi:hypothetical protein